MDYLDKIRQHAASENIPIIEQEGLEILTQIINKHKPGLILEIGTAIGYSAIQMHLINGALVTTIERDNELYQQAVYNVEHLALNDKITLIYNDALLLDNTNIGGFDMLYIDAAKSQYRKFFEKYLINLKPGAIVVFDNLLFHGFVKKDPKEIKSRNLRQMMRKLNEFLVYIENHPEYDFTLIKKGDGIGIATRKELDD